MFDFFSRSSKPIKLWFQTDIHCHIVPGVDDGSPDVETSVELVARMMELGLTKIIPSPHVTAMTFENSRETLDGPFARLQTALDAGGMSGVVQPYGAENRIDELFQKNLDEQTVISHPGKNILMENAFVQEPWGLDNIIFNVKVRGFQPFFAHPERFAYYIARPKRLKELHQYIPFQVNVLSLAGYYGKEVRKMATEMVDAGLVDFLGTDIHAFRHTDCLKEYLASKEAPRHAKKLASIKNDSTFL